MKRLDFNQDWNFWKEGGEKQEKVNLPHDAMLSEKRDKDNATQSGGAYFAGGTYHYTKKLYIQEGWENVFLECEGVYQNSTVKVNGSILQTIWIFEFLCESDAAFEERCGK